MSTQTLPTLPQYILVLSEREIARIRVGKHIERAYRHPGFTNNTVIVLLGHKRALPSPASKHMRKLTMQGDVEPFHINGENLRAIETDTSAYIDIKVGNPPRMLLTIMSDKTHRLARAQMHKAPTA